MSDEELSNVIDRAEDEYQKLKDKVIEQQEEIERLQKENQILMNSMVTEAHTKETKEIERLNNIINEFEKWLKDYIKLFDEPDMLEEQTLEDLKEVLDKIQELKGSESNGSI